MRTLLTPPVFDDEDKTLEARLLHVILLALFGVTAATYLTPLFVSDLVLTLPMLFELLTACLGLIGGLLFLMRRGYVRLTSQILVGLFWITMTILIVLTGGVRAPAYFGYPVAVALCGLLLSGRASILLTALSVVAGFAILTGANRDVLASLSVIPDTPVLWFSASVYLILLAVLQFLATRAMRVALKRARASEAQYRMLFEEAPYGICIADSKNRIQNVNSWAVTMLGYPLEEVIGRVTADFIAPEDLLRMPAASPDEIKAQPSLEWERSLVHKDGRRVSVMISSRYMPDDRFQYIMRDITERKQAEASIRQREAILEAVAFAAEKFLRTSDWRANIETVLEKLGQRIGASHAYLFENHLAPDGTPLTSIRYEWSAPGIPSDLEAPEFQNSLIYEPGFEQWAENLSRGEPFYGSHKSLPPAEVDQLVRRGIKSLLDMPIYVGEGWWGIIGFDDLVAVREWSAAEVDALKAAASIIGAAIQRERVDTVLRQSEALYRRAIEAAGAVPYYRDWRADTYTFMGEGIAQITSYSAAEMTPTLWDSLEEEASPRGELAGLSHPEAQSRVRSGQVHQWECDYRIRTRDGQSRWVADSSVQVRDEHGVRIGVIGILQDITERKQAESALQESEALYRRAIEAAGAAPYYLDYATDAYKFISDKMAEITGYPLSEITPDLMGRLEQEYEMLGEAVRYSKEKAVQLARSGKLRVWQCDSRILTRTGEVRWISDSSIQILDEGGKATGAIGIVLDITDRKQALEEVQRLNAELEERVAQRTEALRASEARVRAMNDASPLGVFFDDVGGQHTYANATYQSILGLSMEEALGTGWVQALHPTDRKWALAEIQAARKRQQSFDLKYRFLRPDGQVVWASVKGAPVRVDDQVLGYVGTVEDITARVNAEEALKRRSTQLEAANRELESFSYSVSHDLRAPVRAIGGFSRLLLQHHADSLNADAAHYLQRVHQGALHMGRLIDDLLAFSRLGRQALRIQLLTTADLAGLVGRIVSDLQAEMPDRHVEAVVENLPPCKADLALLKHVLINLLSNAFKFTQSRPIAHIEVGSLPTPHGPAYFVRDNGVGFDMRYAHKLFNVFQRLHRADEFEGTGVGLAIVQRIIQKHGGRIWAEAEVDNGAAFYFTLND